MIFANVNVNIVDISVLCVVSWVQSPSACVHLQTGNLKKSTELQLYCCDKCACCKLKHRRLAVRYIKLHTVKM